MEQELLNKAATALRKAALNEEAKRYLLSNPSLFKILKKAANRYIGGETLEETIEKVKSKNTEGFKCSVEFMGEGTKSTHEANDARDEFIRICQVIKNNALNSTVSLDLSHIGLDISQDLCLQNLHSICEEAAKGNLEVIISAEDTGKTDAVLDVYKRISKMHRNLGITLQAYLLRTEDDFKDVVKLEGRVRIVKGAFETPPGLSLPRGEKLDSVYLDYVDQVLSKGHLCSIATHDRKIQDEARKLISNHKAKSSLYEFESLFGIQNDQLAQLKKEGHPTKIYFVYGKEWYLYLCNRLAEYPLNVFQALQDMVE